jgi:hypothetical protein
MCKKAVQKNSYRSHSWNDYECVNVKWMLSIGRSSRSLKENFLAPFAQASMFKDGLWPFIDCITMPSLNGL